MLDEKNTISCKILAKILLPVTSLPINRHCELIDWWRNFQTFVQDRLLPLQTNIFWPTDKARQISLRLDTLTNAEISWALFEQRVCLLFLLKALLRHRRRRGNFLCSTLFRFRRLKIFKTFEPDFEI